MYLFQAVYEISQFCIILFGKSKLSGSFKSVYLLSQRNNSIFFHFIFQVHLCAHHFSLTQTRVVCILDIFYYIFYIIKSRFCPCVCFCIETVIQNSIIWIGVCENAFEIASRVGNRFRFFSENIRRFMRFFSLQFRNSIRIDRRFKVSWR